MEDKAKIRAVAKPCLPASKVSKAVCGNYPLVVSALRTRGIEVVLMPKSDILPEPVAHHADMRCCHAAENAFFASDAQSVELLSANKLAPRAINAQLGNKYPHDVPVNCLFLGNRLIANMKSCAPEIVAFAKENDYTCIDVKQGYTRCSIAVVDENTVITSDKQIAKRLDKYGVDVLVISAGGISLLGYNYGFIGGCCSKVSPTELLFYGDPMRHRDADRMMRFLEYKGVAAVKTHDGKLIDFGGFIPVEEYIPE